jgi:predicted PurR-regulated permease PerM
MNVDQATLRKLLSEDLTETLLRVVLILLLVIVCVRVFMPFSHLVILGMIRAVALYPLYERVVQLFGGRRGLAATVLILASLLLLGIPLVLLGGTVATQLSELYTALEHNTLAIKPPNPKVAEWPLVGERLFNAWNDAATNLPAFLQKNQAIIRGYARKALAMAAGGAAAAGIFLAAIVVAGIMMAYAEACGRFFERVLIRLTDSVHGPNLRKLSIATIRSVATGVVGVAFIQAILLGMGFLIAGIPAAGVLALIVMFLGILQLPALLVSLPVVGYLWWAGGDSSTAMKVIFSIYFVLAGMADNVLKPLLLGRGVEAPMLVILIGAIGGMVTGGMTGLFLGAVLLAVGYQIFMEWVDGSARGAGAAVPPADAAHTDNPT